jgi:hypothetical protein
MRSTSQSHVTRTGHRLSALIPVVTVAAMLAGCGGSGSDGPSLTRAQLVARATPICRATVKTRVEASKKLEKENTAAGPPFAALAASAPALGASQTRAVAQLRKLSPPASLAKDWQSLLAGLQQLADDTAKIGADAKEKNIKAIEAIVSGGTGARTRLVTIAKRDGLEPCGSAN